MKTNATKKITTTLLATTLACAMAPASALARVGGARTSVRAGISQQLGGMGQPTTLGQQLGMMNNFGRPQQAGLAEQLGMFGQMGTTPFGNGNVAVMGPGTYAFAGDMNGMMQVDGTTGNVTINLRDNMGAQTPAQPDAAMNAGTQTPEQGNNAAQPSMPGSTDQQQGTMNQNGQQGGMPGDMGQGNMFQGGQPGDMSQGGMPNQQGNVSSATSAGTIVTGTTTNSAASLVADYENATYITVTDDNSQVKITEAGTYIISGASSSGNIVVKKGTTGVVLVLQDLDLTSTTGATLSVNKGAEAKIVVSGNVTLTDAEDPTLEDVSDDYDGAVIKVKAGATAYLCGDGTLTLNGDAKNGIKVTGDADEGYGSLVIDGATININATNDAINANYDLAILSGTLNIAAGDDAIHADRILTIGDEATHAGPTINITKSYEGIEATVVNICGGKVTVNATDDAINAANSDGTFASLGYSINMTGGTVVSNSRADGFDSNGNVNLIGGTATITSASTGGDAGIDYDGQLYVSDEFVLNNNSGVAGPDGMGMGGMPGQMGASMGGAMSQPGATMGGQMGQAGMGNQMGGGMGGMR